MELLLKKCCNEVSWRETRLLVVFFNYVLLVKVAKE